MCGDWRQMMPAFWGGAELIYSASLPDVRRFSSPVAVGLIGNDFLGWSAWLSEPETHCKHSIYLVEDLTVVVLLQYPAQRGSQ